MKKNTITGSPEGYYFPVVISKEIRCDATAGDRQKLTEAELFVHL